MAVLERIDGPRDLDGLSHDELVQLAAEIREFLVREVSKTGGHLGPNLGVVELTIAMHRVFDSPRDAIVFDTGHQSYVHKLLTGRRDFSRLRQEGGMAGYPQRSESVHDIVESSHASSSLSWADGISKAFAMTGQPERHVVAVVGDGALTGGMTWEALNNISDDNSRNLVIVVNDNGRSYAPTIGGISRFLANVRTRRTYRRLHLSSRKFFYRLGTPARSFYRGVRGGLHGFMSRFWNNEALYSNLDIKYIGPVNGHDLRAMEEALRQARNYGAPVIVHAITEKGRGYEPALMDVADQFHAVGQIDPETGEPIEAASKPSWTAVFGDELVELAERERPHRRCHRGHAAPDRPAQDGRAVPGPGHRRRDRRAARGDQRRRSRIRRAASGGGDLRHVHQPRVRPGADGCRAAPRRRHVRARPRRRHRARTGRVTTASGISRSSRWCRTSASRLRATPRGCARSWGRRSRSSDAPTVIRFPRGSVGNEFDAVRRTDDGVDVLREAAHKDVLIVTVGPMAKTGLQVAERLAAQGIGATVIDPRWVVPVPDQPHLAGG